MSLPERNARGFLDPRTWLRGLVRAVIRPRPRIAWRKWIDANVVIPESSGGPNTGRMRTSRFPIFRGLYALATQRHVHFLTLCSSARAGKTLFCICLVLHWISERFGWIAWLDPTRNSARKLVRDELDDFLLECKPVRALAIITKKTWTTLEKHFRGKRMRIIGSGAEADLHGFNCELAIINEADACRASTDASAASADKIIARTKLFAHSRLVVRNSTPQAGEFGPTWTTFSSATQHHCYVPCPHCSAKRAHVNQHIVFEPPAEEDCRPGWSPLSYDPRLAGWQRFTFFSEKATVPFDEELHELRDAPGAWRPRAQWREEKTGQASFERFAIMEPRPRLDDPTQMEMVRVGWNRRQVLKGTTYQCAYCGGEIEQSDYTGWMMDRYRWMPHTPEAEPLAEDESAAPAGLEEHVSAHVWSWYSPFETWGVIAWEFLEAKGDRGKLLKFYSFTLGRPLPESGSSLKETDIDRAVSRCPVRYVLGQMPYEAEMLTMTIDRQGTERWYSIRAWGILWDHPERPSWNALIDYGEIASDQQIAERAGHAPDSEGHLRRFRYRRTAAEIAERKRLGLDTEPVREFAVTAGLYDCGFEQDGVFAYCLTQSAWLSPSKGGGPEKTSGNPIKINDGVMDGRLDLVWFWSDLFANELYFDCIVRGAAQSGQSLNWWLPVNVCATYKAHLTDEHIVVKNGKRVREARVKNDLGDTEKNQRVLAGKVEEALDEIRDARAEAEAKAKEAKAKD